jgi:transposase
MEPGAVASAVAREAGVHPSQLYRWRQELCGRTASACGFTEVTIATEPGVASRSPIVPPAGVVEIELASGVRMRVSGNVDAALVSAALTALTGQRR